MSEPASTATVGDARPTSARRAAFCDRGSPEVFEAVVGPRQVWQEDPYDVDTIHADAREAFGRLLARATAVPAPVDRGRVLLLRGDAGSGKTHLMRAFRSSSHRDGSAHFAYLQLTSAAANYGQYMLANVIGSLEYPYAPPTVPETGLQRLSTAVLDGAPALTEAERAAICGDGTEGDPVAAVYAVAERVVADPRFAGCDEDLVRALLFLQRDDPRVRNKVLKWLRGEEMNGYDRSLIGDLVPRPRPEQATELIAQLARLVAAAQGAALVLCLDQLEDVGHMEGAAERFRQIVNELVAFADAVPTGIVVLSCLDDYYTTVREQLPGPKLDRIEHNPPPLRLTGHRSSAEVEAMVARRLGHLYEESGLPVEAGSTYPFTAAHLAPLANLNTRRVLEMCRTHHQRCVTEQGWIEPSWTDVSDARLPEPASAPSAVNLDQAWNDAVNGPAIAVPESEAELADLLARTIGLANVELAEPDRITAAVQTGSLVSVVGRGTGGAERPFLVAVCDRSARGGGLTKQVDAVAAAAAGRPVVLVRSTPFPVDPKSIVSKRIGKLIGTTGRRVEVSNGDWRAMVAFAAFAGSHGGQAAFEAWQRASRPLTQLRAFQRIVDVRPLAEPRDVAPAPAPPPVVQAVVEPEPQADAAGQLKLGKTREVLPAPVLILPEELKQHMVFIGGNGTGKTTAALRLIEQLLARGIPAVLVDRKGDLSRYADPAAWAVADDPAFPKHGPRRRALRERLDVDLFTPGSGDRGRPLALPVFPDDLAGATETDRGEMARFSADALGSMMGITTSRAAANGAMVAILTKAIEVMAQATPAGQPVELEQVRELIATQDDTLLNAVGGLDAKHYRKLAELMLTMKINHGSLLDGGGGERLDVGRLFARHGVAGRARLTVVNTQSLRTADEVQFWLSRFLFAVDRWRGRTPSPTLQAVLMLDEADQYLPATSKPPTKQPLESLLKRGRSAGLGVMLATQSPGDLDYKGRDNLRAWLVGRVQDAVGINKLKPLFAGARLDVAAKLPQQSPGEFYLLREGHVTPVRAGRSLIETKQVPEEQVLRLARERREIRG